MAVVEVVEAKVTADTSQFDQSMDRVKGSFTQVGDAAKRGMATAATALATGAAAAAGQGITAFAGFESGMNEVFTLLPGASEDAMAQMGEDVKNFSTEMGVATTQAIPALYQAISAGVPQNNVFDFLETAQMAAVGGVTDLETAVDGISSVVNAYGSDVISAAEASDLMFTAVRLGKTDFEQLSSSLFNVTPIASSLGVDFENVTAALASLTAKGTPTSVATTQLRAAFTELAKEGTKVSDVFQNQTGQSFQEFMDSTDEFGNQRDLFDALGQLAAGARDADTEILDLFGSVEAGQAVLGLLSDDAFADAMGAMEQSAGATSEAFETMEDSVSRDFEKLKATLQVFLIDLGQKLAPAVGKVIDFVQELADAFGKKGLRGVLEVLRNKLKPVEDWMKRNKPIIAAVATVIGVALVAALYSAAAGMFALLSPFVLVTAAIAALVAGLVYAYENWGWFRDAVDAAIDAAQIAFAWFMEDAVPVLKEFGETVWEVTQDVAQFFADLYEELEPVFEFIFDLYVKIYTKLWDAKDEVWTVIQAIYGFFKTLYDEISPYIEDIIGLYVDIYTGLWNAKDEIWGVIQSIIGFFGSLFTGIFTYVGIIVGAISGMVNYILDIPNKIGDLATTVKDKFVGVGSAILDGIKDGIGAATDFVSDFAEGVANSIIRFINWNVVGRINRALPNSIPIPYLPDIPLPANPIPPIPLIGLAEGGIVTRPLLAMIGEGGESEAVIPLSKLDRMMNGGGGQTVNVTVNMPAGSDGDDVVRALQDYARRRGAIPVPIGTARY